MARGDEGGEGERVANLLLAKKTPPKISQVVITPWQSGLLA